MRKYRLVAKKGEGTFSEVLKAQNVKDGRYHAIKCMKNRFESIDQVNNLREIQALRRLSPHEHIISLEEVLYDQPTGRLALVFELMDANLYELIRGRRHYLNPTLIKSYMWQLMKSLDHMHRKGIFHRDIKPENILIESTGEMGKGLKLADFGSCRGIYSKQPYTEYISTRWYRAPECLLTDGYYGPEMDMWGAGCVMFEITSLYPLFPGSNEIDQVNRIHKVLGTPTQDLLAKFKGKGASHISFDFPPQKGIGIQQLVPHASPDSIDLMVKLLKYDASERMTAREAMRHAYFKDIRETESKQQTESSKLPAQGNTMPSANVNQTMSTQPSTQQHGFGSDATVKSQFGTSQGVNKNLPSINNPNLDAGSHYGNKSNAVNNENQYQQQPVLMMQKQAQQVNKNTTNQVGAGSLPPIMPIGSQNLGINTQNKYADPKNSGRSNAPSNNTQKKRKKYRMNYVQQRAAQNSESVMKAYGVPKYFGASGGEGASSNISSMAPSVGQYQVRNYAPANKKY